MRKSTDTDIIIGKNLVKLRKEKSLSQTDIAKILDVTFQQVQKYEKGLNRLSAFKLYILSQYFNIPMEYFFVS